MKVKLIAMTPNPIDVMWTAARTCYSSKGPIDMWDETRDVPKDEYKEEIEDKRWNLVKKVLDSGHCSITEHVYFTFAIEGVTRTLLAQLTRHRAGIVFSVQSQRYVEIKEDISLFERRNYMSEDYLNNKELIEILDKYFEWDHLDYPQFHMLMNAMYAYLYQTREGVKPEDARQILPNCTKTNITMSVNLRELMHICNLRLCTRAQDEIRTLFGIIKVAVNRENDKLAKLLVPTCEVNNVCYEGKCCGRRPHISKVIEGYKENRYGSK